MDIKTGFEVYSSKIKYSFRLPCYWPSLPYLILQATLCSMKGCMRALVAQLKSESEDLQQVLLTAQMFVLGISRLISWLRLSCGSVFIMSCLNHGYINTRIKENNYSENSFWHHTTI